MDDTKKHCTHRFTPKSGSGNYDLSVKCDGAPNHEYDAHIMTCDQNTITKTTTDTHREQFFQIKTNSKHDIRFETCGSLWDTTLEIYSDSLYSNKIVGGDNDACDSGFQEIYTKNAMDPGNYYVKISYATGCTNPGNTCYGQYTFKITCSGNYPSAQPTPSPTESPTNMPTKLPTSSTLTPSNDPTIDPTIDPTADPTADPTTDPTKYPSPAPSVSPSNAPSADPTKMPTMRPTKLPTLGRDGEIVINVPDEKVDTEEDNVSNGNANVNAAPVAASTETDMHYTIILVALIAAIVCCCGFIVATLWWNKKDDKKRDNKSMDGTDQEGVVLDTTAPQTAITPMSTSVEMQNVHGLYRINSHSTALSDIPNVMHVNQSHYQMGQIPAQMMNGYPMNTMNTLPMTAALNANMDGIVNAINQSVEPAQTAVGIVPNDEMNVGNLYTKGGDNLADHATEDTSEDDEAYGPMYGKNDAVIDNGHKTNDGL